MLRGPRADTARFAGRAYNWNGGRHWGGVTGRQLLVSVLWIFRLGYYGLGYGYPSYGIAITVMATADTIGSRLLRILPLPLRILAVRDLQLRVLKSPLTKSGRSNAAGLLISHALLIRSSDNKNCAVGELLST